MNTTINPAVPGTCTAFEGDRLLASGPLTEVALAVKSAAASASPRAALPVVVFDDATGRVIDIDTRGTDREVLGRLARGPELGPPASPVDVGPAEPRGRGRPKLGVVAREVTLLPRHWDWLNSQSGGASVALRKLVEEARKSSGFRDRRRAAQAAAYSFMSAMAGNLPGFEEAARALFADDRRAFSQRVAGWPEDVREYSVKLAFSDQQSD